jgi:hypothetical protein
MIGQAQGNVRRQKIAATRSIFICPMTGTVIHRSLAGHAIMKSGPQRSGE